METSLHRQLKEHYASGASRVEVQLEKFRIDVVRPDDTLVEIQHGSLSAIRSKVQTLTRDHPVVVVKPLIVLKQLVKQDAAGGRVVSRRQSPKKGSVIDLFDELVYFTSVFPHPNLRLEALLVEIEEWRYPGHGKRRRRRKNDHQIEDQKLVKIQKRIQLKTPKDLKRLASARLPRRFHTGHLAERLHVSRRVAQRIAYCYRHMGTAREVGKQGNACLYEFTS